MEKKDLEILKGKYFEAQAALESETSFLEDLKKRISSTAIRVNSMVRELEGMTEVRNVILKQISRNEATEEDLKKQTLNIDDLKISQQNIDDLLTVLKGTEIETQVKVQKLSKDLEGKNHELWFNISLFESEKIREANFLPVLRAWASFVQSGAPANLGHWLAGRFNNFSLDLKQVTKDLEKEYLVPSQKGEK